MHPACKLGLSQPGVLETIPSHLLALSGVKQTLSELRGGRADQVALLLALLYAQVKCFAPGEVKTNLNHMYHYEKAS